VCAAEEDVFADHVLLSTGGAIGTGPLGWWWWTWVSSHVTEVGDTLHMDERWDGEVSWEMLVEVLGRLNGFFFGFGVHGRSGIGDVGVGCGRRGVVVGLIGGVVLLVMNGGLMGGGVVGYRFCVDFGRHGGGGSGLKCGWV
jgi:hypothetical protein